MELPILQYEAEICQLVRTHKVTIIQGEPGCGKTSKIPQFLLDDARLSQTLRSRRVKVAVTQPRRVAAITIAKRVAFERNCRIGGEVAYSIRFEDTSTPRTHIKFMTDGVLLREVLQDRLLKKLGLSGMDPSMAKLYLVRI